MEILDGLDSGEARDLLREHVPGPGPDRPPAPDLAAARELICSGKLVKRVTYVAGELL